MRPLHDALAYIHNRWVCPSDRQIIRHPDYPQGHYHDADYRMLYLLFQMVVDFVEIECGACWGLYHFETRLQMSYRVIQQLPLLHWLLPPGRNARRGLHHLRWAMSLKDSPSQAQQAKDVFALYRFWKHERPARQDPWDWAETFEDTKRIPSVSEDGILNFSPEYSAKLTTAGELEEDYNMEDQEMLHLLIKIRQGLWT